MYGILEGLLAYSAIHANTSYSVNQESSETQADSLETLLTEKISCLSNILAQIQQDMQSRRALSGTVMQHIDQHYCYLKTKLFELYTWALGRSRSIEQRRSSLEKQLDALDQEKRLELVKSWQDIEGLKKEFRQWFKQYRDVMQRAKIILSDKIIAKKRSDNFITNFKYKFAF